MKKSELMKNIQAEKKLALETVSLFPADANFRFISAEEGLPQVFMSNSTFAEVIELLHDLRPVFGKWKVDHYYLDRGHLAISYTFSEMEEDGIEKHTLTLVTYSSDAEHALEVVGMGKCHIKKEVCEVAARTYESEKVVCNM